MRLQKRVFGVLWLALFAAGPLAPAARAQLVEIARFQDTEAVGIAVSRQGRVFVTLPYSNYSTEQHAASVAEVLPDGRTVPYPDAAWNAKAAPPTQQPRSRFLCTQGIAVDEDDNLWVLDTGSPRRAGVVAGGAKLVKIALASNQVVQVLPIPVAVTTPQGFLNDVRVDAKRQVAYASETGPVAGLVVVDLRTGAAGRIDAERLPSRGEQDFGPTRVAGGWGFPDGLVLTPNGRFLYFQTLSGTTVFRVPTAALRRAARRPAGPVRQARAVGEAVVADGLALDAATGYVCCWAVKDRALVRYRPGQPVQVMLRDPNLILPDGIAVGPDGAVYFTDPQFARGQGVDRTVRPFRVYKFQPGW